MEFKVNLKADACGTSFQTNYKNSYSILTKILGSCLPVSDGYKVSTKWILESEKGHVVTLYDYKETKLYHGGYPSVEEFRNQKSYDWHIGAVSEEVALEFKYWLQRKIKESDLTENEIEAGEII